MGYDSPINDTIEHTHVTYDNVVESALRANANGTGTEVMIASHNEDSIVVALELMNKLGIQKESGGVYFGQLLGMRDSVSFGLGAAGYNVFKWVFLFAVTKSLLESVRTKTHLYRYLPYGHIEEVVPYLVRRAEENSSLMGGVAKDKNILFTEIMARLSGRRTKV